MGFKSVKQQKFAFTPEGKQAFERSPAALSNSNKINPTVTKELRSNKVDYEATPKFKKLKKMMG